MTQNLEQDYQNYQEMIREGKIDDLFTEIPLKSHKKPYNQRKPQNPCPYKIGLYTKGKRCSNINNPAGKCNKDNFISCPYYLISCQVKRKIR